MVSLLHRATINKAIRDSRLHPGAQSVATAYNNKVKQRGAPCKIRWNFMTACAARHPRSYCQRHSPYGPLFENKTSSTKPEALYCGRQKTDPQPQLTYKENFTNVVSETCKQTDRQQTYRPADCMTLQPSQITFMSYLK